MGEATTGPRDTAARAAPLLAPPGVPGVLWAFRFDAQGRGHRLALDADPFADPSSEADDGFTWIHLDLVDARIEGLIAAGRCGAPEEAGAVLGHDDHQRVAIAPALVGGVIVDLHRDFTGAVDPSGVGRLHFLLDARRLVTGRRRPVAGAEATRASVESGTRAGSPTLLLEMLVGRAAGAMAEIASALAADLDRIEDGLLDDAVRDDAHKLGVVRRTAVRLHRQLAGLRAVFHRLEAEAEEAAGERDGEEAVPESAPALPFAELAGTAGRLAQRLDAIDRDMMLIAERSRLLQDEFNARVAAQTNRNLYVLSILTAFFLPPTLVTGLFGMNTKGLPLSEFESGSWLAIGLCVLAALATFLVIRQLGLIAPRGRGGR